MVSIILCHAVSIAAVSVFDYIWPSNMSLLRNSKLTMMVSFLSVHLVKYKQRDGESLIMSFHNYAILTLMIIDHDSCRG